MRMYLDRNRNAGEGRRQLNQRNFTRREMGRTYCSREDMRILENRNRCRILQVGKGGMPPNRSSRSCGAFVAECGHVTKCKRLCRETCNYSVSEISRNRVRKLRSKSTKSRFSVIPIILFVLCNTRLCCAKVNGHTDIGKPAYADIGIQRLRGLQNDTLAPTLVPSSPPTTVKATEQPTTFPTIKPTIEPTSTPSYTPSKLPSLGPSAEPSRKPSLNPSSLPSYKPSNLPTLLPTLKPTLTQLPTSGPSQKPSSEPSSSPSQSPTKVPTSNPTLSLKPTSSPSVSISPTTSPSLSPSSKPSNKPSALPSLSPSNQPSLSSRPSVGPSLEPSSKPSLSQNPSSVPTSSPTSSPSNFPSSQPTFIPTSNPTGSTKPSTIPSSTPSMRPSATPSEFPSYNPTLSQHPSLQPSDAPTVEPTYTRQIVSKATFLQIFYSATAFTTLEAKNFEKVMRLFTDLMTEERTDRVETNCEFLEGRSMARRLRGLNENEPAVLVKYTMEYKSIHTNVTDYDELFKNYVNNNIAFVVKALNSSNVDVTGAERTFILENTSRPTMSPSKNPTTKPSAFPTGRPTTSPSGIPSTEPSITPTNYPSTLPSDPPSKLPSIPPSNAPSNEPSIEPTKEPTISPTNQPSEFPSSPPKSQTTLIAGAVAGTISAGALIFVMGICFRRWKRRGDTASGLTPSLFPLTQEVPPAPLPLPSSRHGNSTLGSTARSTNGANPVTDPAENTAWSDANSFISTGSSRRDDSDSDIEYDDTYNLADEFDKYKDQNVEKMRSEVEGMSSNFDGMMSQALTKALMDDMDEDNDAIDDLVIDPQNSMEIEATVLCDMHDWLKKRENANADERREFMQETLNAMVSNVRRGLMSPEDASRTIHGSAAMLGLQLAENLPETTLIVTGMRKQVTKDHVIKAFQEFGEIENAGVSSKERGFGVVRYRSPNSVQSAMERFRFGEIVVQDVGVMVRILKADNMGEVVLKRQYSNERRSR